MPLHRSWGKVANSVSAWVCVQWMMGCEHCLQDWLVMHFSHVCMTMYMCLNMDPCCCNCRYRSEHVGRSITVYCCCCLCRWAPPCSCVPSTGPRCWRRRASAASSRWSGPDPLPPRNCWSDAVVRSLWWLQTRAHKHPHGVRIRPNIQENLVHPDPFGRLWEKNTKAKRGALVTTTLKGGYGL